MDKKNLKDIDRNKIVLTLEQALMALNEIQDTRAKGALEMIKETLFELGYYKGDKRIEARK